MIIIRYLLTTIAFSLMVSFAVAQSFDLICDNTDPIISAWIISDGVTTTKYYNDINDETTCLPTITDSGVQANVQAIYYDADYVWVEATGCPAYMTGPYNGDGNSNYPDDQARTIILPRNPVADPGNQINDYSVLGAIGYLVNGVALFGAGDGMSYNNESTWWRNAGVAENEGFGCDRSHPAGTNLHHHQNPIPFNYNGTAGQSDVCDCFPSDAFYTPNSTEHSPLIGFAIDGYPIYGPYAYANTDGTGSITRMTTSYQLRNISTRTTYADGTTAPNEGPEISTTWPLGIFYQDFEFVANSGVLDYYNGRFAVTPEYPCGTYAYYATMDSEGNSEFPYIVGLSFYGEISPCESLAGVPSGPGGGDGPGGGGTGGGDPGGGDPGDGTDTDSDCIVPTDGSVVLYASVGNLPTCSTVVDPDIMIVSDCTTSIFGNTANHNLNLSIAPNIAQHEIEVTYELKTAVQINLININGVVVQQYNQQASNVQKLKIDISELSTGLNFVQLISEKNVITKKFIKE